MKKFGEKSLRFFLSCILILNFFVGLKPLKANGVSFDGGSGTVEDPYIISTAEQLDAVRNNLSASYKLVRDIDLTDYLNQKNDPKGWEPIGRSSGACYKGTFDGGGHKISGLWMNRPDEDYVAFFGGFKGDNTEIKNLNIEISPKGIVGRYYVAGIVGLNESRISECSATGGPVSGMSSTGKFAGANYKFISNCYAAGEKVSFSGGNLGSIIGDMGGFTGKSDSSNSIIENCFSMCDVESKSKMYNGGFIGIVYGDTIVRRCYSSGNVNIDDDTQDSWTGGFVGRIQTGIISNCYASGSVLGTHKYLSGFLGNLYSNIENSYACCNEVGCDTKEFLGAIRKGASALKCYYDESKGVKKAIRYIAANESEFTSEIYGKTTEEMHKKATYEGWDFDTVWDIKEGESYPYLRSSLPMYYSFGPRSAVYTGSGQSVEITKNECGEAAGAGNATAVMYSGATTKPVNAGEYEISVNLGAGSATNPATGVKLLGSYTIEKATLGLEHFNYDLSPTSHEEGVKRPVTLSAKTGTAFTNEINDLIGNGKIWLEYKTQGEDWTKEAPINAATYEVKIVIGEEATNFKAAELAIGSYTVEKATLSLEHFNYDLSPTTHEEGVKRPVTLSAKTGTAFTNEINDLIENGKIWIEYKTQGEEWTKEAPINSATYEVKIVIGEEATNFKPAEFTIGNYIVGEKRSIIYKNYDGSDITELDSSLPKEYIEGTEVSIPQTAPNSDMEGWDFLGYWDCALDNSQDSLVDLEGSGYENEKSLNFEAGTKVETISKDSKGDVTVFARYSSQMFDADINGRENYIFAPPGVFPNETTASMRILEKGTDEYEKVLEDVDKKDKHNVKIVEFEVFDKNGEKIQPKTFFGDTVIGFKIPEDFKVDDTTLIRVTSGEDINLRSTIWSDPENPDLKYIEGTTDHFSPYAILSPWSDFLDAVEDNFTETGETNWVLITFIISAIVVIATLALLWYKKRHPKNYKHS